MGSDMKMHGDRQQETGGIYVATDSWAEEAQYGVGL